MNAKITKSKTPVPAAKKPLPKVVVENGHATVQDAAPEETPEVEAATTEATPVETASTEPEAPRPEATSKSKMAKAAKKENTTDKQPDGIQKPEPPPGELVVFALRMTLEERVKLHETAGPAKASKFARMILIAAANRDLDQIKEIIEATTPAA